MACPLPFSLSSSLITAVQQSSVSHSRTLTLKCSTLGENDAEGWWEVGGKSSTRSNLTLRAYNTHAYLLSLVLSDSMIGMRRKEDDYMEGKAWWKYALLWWKGVRRRNLGD
jgi:hypothetical protein